MGLRVPPAFPAASRCTVGGEGKVCSQCCRVKLGGGHGVCPCHLGAAPEFAGVSKHVTWNTSLPRVSGTVAVGPVLAPGRESGPVSVAAEGRPGAEIDGVEVVAALAEAEAQMADGRRRTGVCSGPPARLPEHRSRPWAGVPPHQRRRRHASCSRWALGELHVRRRKQKPRKLTRPLAKERSGASPSQQRRPSLWEQGCRSLSGTNHTLKGALRLISWEFRKRRGYRRLAPPGSARHGHLGPGSSWRGPA